VADRPLTPGDPQPVTFARAADCPAGLPAALAVACSFMTRHDVTAWTGRVNGEGYDVVIAPEGWRPPPPPAGPAGYRLTLLCPSRADWARLFYLRITHQEA
jgi:hypothetical protein